MQGENDNKIKSCIYDTATVNERWGMLMKLLFNQKYSDMIIIVKRNMERNIGKEVNSSVKFKAYAQNLTVTNLKW